MRLCASVCVCVCVVVVAKLPDPVCVEEAWKCGRCDYRTICPNTTPVDAERTRDNDADVGASMPPSSSSSAADRNGRELEDLACAERSALSTGFLPASLWRQALMSVSDLSKAQSSTSSAGHTRRGQRGRDNGVHLNVRRRDGRHDFSNAQSGADTRMFYLAMEGYAVPARKKSDNAHESNGGAHGSDRLYESPGGNEGTDLQVRGASNDDEEDDEEEEEEEEEDIAAARIVMETSAHVYLHKYDFHIAYHESFRVPVVYFRGYDHFARSAPMLSYETVVDDLNLAETLRPRARRGGASPTNGPSTAAWTMTLSWEESPITNTPWLMLHPCETASLMKMMLASTPLRAGDGNLAHAYMSAWLSVVFQALGIRIDSDERENHDDDDAHTHTIRTNE